MHLHEQGLQCMRLHEQGLQCMHVHEQGCSACTYTSRAAMQALVVIVIVQVLICNA